MEQVCMVMECLTADGAIPGFAEALVLVEVSVEVEAEDGVAVEADLDIGSRF
jgi:hypothetical protein